MTNIYTKLAFIAAGTFLSVATLDLESSQAATLSMEVPFQFEDISTTGTRVLAGADDVTASAALGFTFDFFGTDYSDVSWSPNGLMTFGGTNSQFRNVDLTTTATLGDLPSIAPQFG